MCNCKKQPTQQPNKVQPSNVKNGGKTIKIRG